VRALLFPVWFLPLALQTGAGPTRPAFPEHVRDPVLNRSLGVECTHCHVENTWTDDTKPQFATARNMVRMVDAINRALDGVGAVSCSTCHAGQRRPSRLPRPALDAELAKWPTGLADVPEAQKLSMTVYNVSLGVGCAHCHVADWKSAEKKAMQTVALMNSMFAEFPKYMPPTARTQCYMCHKGSTTPGK
jgi:hypothetical protein